MNDKFILLYCAVTFLLYISSLLNSLNFISLYHNEHVTKSNSHPRYRNHDSL